MIFLTCKINKFYFNVKAFLTLIKKKSIFTVLKDKRFNVTENIFSPLKRYLFQSTFQDFQKYYCDCSLLRHWFLQHLSNIRQVL